MKERLPLWIAAFWWGSLTTVGFVVVPMLFANLPTPAMAGTMAAQLFAAQTWVAMVCGLLLLMHSQGNSAQPHVGRPRAAMFFVVSGMMLALLSEFAVAPKIVARENLAVWHSVGTLMYALQWVCSALSFWKLMPTTNPRQV
ncbi:MAG: DUF4149 domain-containing protein [Rhodoferax sp.]|nr:DUF4149 domain-containing protein [Rhodoferax sp.]MBP7491655.1 DUF4149 domain-containing protein [Rhodoferax sp.]